jgi:hypothetical protein
MKLRLIQEHYHNYTGQMGITLFVDGLSTEDVLPNVAGRMAAVMNCEWEDGSPANVGQIYLDSRNNEAPVESEVKAAQVEQEQAYVEPAIVQVKETYTEEQLGLIADEKGINGLREIADPLGIKNNSIGGLIESILK